MNARQDRITKGLIEAIQTPTAKTSPYDTEAEVIRVEGDTAWVHISGGIDETPVKMTINCEKGDKVQVRVGGGSAWLVGNATAPPTDDTTAIEARVKSIEAELTAKQADAKAEQAQTTADNATVIAEQAKSIADDTNQYFWFTGEGTDTGAHITEVPQDEFTDSTSPNYHSGGNLLARSNGIAIRDGLTELSTFSTSSAQVGVSSGGHTVIQSSGMDIYGGDGTRSLAHIGYDTGNAESGTAVAPFYTFGIRNTSDGIGNYSVAEGRSTKAIGYASHAEGSGTTASGGYAHAEGGATTASGGDSHAEGFNNTASGDYSHAEGGYNTASASYAHAEGRLTEASQMYAHSEGNNTKATNYASHAEGYLTTASGSYSHAEGTSTTASGQNSHAEGNHTEAASPNQHVQGKYNVIDSTETYADIVGAGTDSARKNIFALERATGDGRYKGDVYVGCNDDSTGGTKLAKDIITTSSFTGNAIAFDTGTTWKDISSTTYPNNSTVSITDAGIYLLIGNIAFSSNSSGRRGIRWYDVTGDTAIVRSQQVFAPANGAIAYQQTICVVETNGSASYKLQAYQNSGSQLNVTPYVNTVRLK